MLSIGVPLQQLPPPSAEEHAISTALAGVMRDIILEQGPMPFSDFMRLALYHPSYGYYMAGRQKFGAKGDFVTAPELSPVFAYCIAEQCAEVLRALDYGSILELGAGSGRMALDILCYLEKINCLPERYYILELSKELQLRQQLLIAEQAPTLLPRVTWLQSLEGLSMEGVIIGNEVVDAMPVERFQITDEGVAVCCVNWDLQINRFAWQLQPASKKLFQAVEVIESKLARSLPFGYCSEINLQLRAWVEAISMVLNKGIMLLIDYGHAFKDYYVPQRMDGTLMCHYRHLATDDVLQRVGLQDITAHVDFTALAEAADSAGFSITGFSDQADFLMNCGLETKLEQLNIETQQDSPEWFNAMQNIKQLILPSAMGKRFKVLIAGKQFDQPLLGIKPLNDRRHYL